MSISLIERQNIGEHILCVYEADNEDRWYSIEDEEGNIVTIDESELAWLAHAYVIYGGVKR